MEYFLQQKLKEDKKFKKYFDENSNQVKYLNRNPKNYEMFKNEIKTKYKLRRTDKINNAIENLLYVKLIYFLNIN